MTAECQSRHVPMKSKKTALIMADVGNDEEPLSDLQSGFGLSAFMFNSPKYV